MGTMGTLAVGIQSWLKFGKATISFAAGGTQRSAKMSTNSEIANLANTQMSKVCFDRPIKSNIAMFRLVASFESSIISIRISSLDLRTR